MTSRPPRSGSYYGSMNLAVTSLSRSDNPCDDRHMFCSNGQVHNELRPTHIRPWSVETEAFTNGSVSGLDGMPRDANIGQGLDVSCWVVMWLTDSKAGNVIQFNVEPFKSNVVGMDIHAA